MRQTVNREDEALPPGWVWTTLGELQYGERRAINPMKTPEQTFEMYSVPSFDSRRPEIVLGDSIGSGKQIVEPGTVLLCKINPRINRVWVVGNNSPWPKIASTEWIPFPAREGLSPDYLCYFLQNADFREFLTLNVSGVGGSLMRARPEAIANYRFPLAPFPEQHRIVAKIEELFSDLDAGVAALKRVQANLKRYRASVLKAACEGRLVPTEAELAREEGRAYEPADVLLRRILAERRARWEAEHRGKTYIEPAAPEMEGLPELPEGWCWARTGELCDCIVPNRDKPKSFSGDIPWITLPDFDEGISLHRSKSGLGLSLDEVRYYRAKIVPTGSVVMSCIGRFGVTAVLGQASVVNQQLHAFLVPIGLEPRYLAYAIKTQVPYMERIATATTIAYLNKDNCNSVPIPLPPLIEQRRIVAEVERRLSVVAELESTVAANLARAGRLRQAVLKRAFEGKLWSNI